MVPLSQRGTEKLFQDSIRREVIASLFDKEIQAENVYFSGGAICCFSWGEGRKN